MYSLNPRQVSFLDEKFSTMQHLTKHEETSFDVPLRSI